MIRVGRVEVAALHRPHGSKPLCLEAIAVLLLQATSLKEESKDDEPEADFAARP
jgi:hypothetical protein